MAARTDLYSETLIRAIDSWQSGSRDKERKARQLREASRCLPPLYREAPEIVFRQVRANAQLGIGIALAATPDAVSSWTTSQEVAQRFREHDQDRYKVMMIFARRPAPNDVILNLNVVYADPDFMDTVRATAERLCREFLGITRWQGSQMEVVLEETIIANDEIVSLGAFRQLSDVVPTIGTPDPKAPSDDEIYRELTGSRTDEHFWTSPDSAAQGVRNAAERIRAFLAERTRSTTASDASINSS